MAKQTFESAMKRLEQIVQDLESGDLSLEKTIGKFEEGVKLSRFCTEKLDETEKRINILLQDRSGNLHEEPFAAGDEQGEFDAQDEPNGEDRSVGPGNPEAGGDVGDQVR